MESNGVLKKAKIGQNLTLQHNNQIRTDTISWLHEQATEPAIQAYLKKMETLSLTFNQAFYLSLMELEAHFAVYPPGAFYKKHIDQFSRTKNRKISCVYYLNESWEEHFGGILKLYNTTGESICEVIPHGNRFICFNSELPHEVLPTQYTRYSIACWLRTR